MKHVLIVDSDTPELNARNLRAAGQTTGQGYEAALRACTPDLATTIVAPYAGEACADMSSFDGVAFTGSGVDWCTDDAQAKPLAKVMEACFAAGLPTLGSCNGMQLAATVLGGSNRASPNGREDGLAKDIQLTPNGLQHPFLSSRHNGFAVPCVHRDEVETLPEGAVLLATNTHSAVQAFAYERDGVRFWGVQYHPEYSLSFIAMRVREWERVSADVADDIAVADADQEAAARLGVRMSDLRDEVRMAELRNWLKSI